MARIFLLAHLNCDHVLNIEQTFKSGKRLEYIDQGQRLGGGGANTGISLVWAEHNVELIAPLSSDPMSQWLIQQASSYGLDCTKCDRSQESVLPLFLLMDPTGERTILRPKKNSPELKSLPDSSDYDTIYINTHAKFDTSWLNSSMKETCVVRQFKATLNKQTCHYLIASKEEFPDVDNIWEYAKNLAGEHLQACIITQANQGARAYSNDGEFTVPAHPCEIINDTTGAGDVYVAGLIHALLEKKNLESAMKDAAIWSTFALKNFGSIPHEDLKTYLQQKSS